MLADGVDVSMWKRGVKAAYRGCPILADHLRFAWVVWQDAGELLAAQHVGMPFGAIAAVHAFHRLGAFMAAVVRRGALAPLGRFVADSFGASKRGVFWTGGRLLSEQSSLIGWPCDPSKDCDDTLSIIALGARCIIDALLKTLAVSVDPVNGQSLG